MLFGNYSMRFSHVCRLLLTLPCQTGNNRAGRSNRVHVSLLKRVALRWESRTRIWKKGQQLLKWWQSYTYLGRPHQNSQPLQVVIRDGGSSLQQRLLLGCKSKRQGNEVWAYQRVIKLGLEELSPCPTTGSMVVLVRAFSAGCTDTFVAQFTVV